MKYKSLRFFIAINSFVGWAVIGIGCLFSLVWAIAAAAHGSVMGFLGFSIIGGFVSAFTGMSIFALGDLYQCFLDIEENTRGAANASKDASNKGSVETNTSREQRSTDTFTYMCPGCNRFQDSEVTKCENCGADNPHHPSNKAKTDTARAANTQQTPPAPPHCPRCGAGMNLGDKFCSSCGYSRG